MRSCTQIVKFIISSLYRLKLRLRHIVFTRILLIAEHDGMLRLYRHLADAALFT